MISRLFLMISWAVALPMMGQEENDASLLNGLDYKVEFQSSVSDGNTPLWLNANKHGLSSLRSFNGYLRGAVERPLSNDSMRQWGVGYALDLVAPLHYTSDMIVQQAYAELRWKKGVLTLGSKEWPMELKDNRLSSGSQTLGINARPVPQLRIALPDYWTLPLLGGWVHLKGHIAYGWTTDGGWQRTSTRQQTKYTLHTMFHSKAGYLKIGKNGRPLSVELGLEMGSQFGGISYIQREGGMNDIHNEGGLAALWHAFIPSGSEVVEDVYKNTSGNNLGSWLLKVNFEQPSWQIGVYADHFFEDHSSMFLLDYNGYGSGINWDKKEENKFVGYDLKDMLLGAEVYLKHFRWMNKIVCEYLYTKYQSGPMYHDHTVTISDHIGGRDNYYNHHIFSGWQHWGQVMGNPLYRSPIYNKDGNVMVENNRFVAWHLGFSGKPTGQWSYRVLGTWQRGFGTYELPFFDPCESVCIMAEADYAFPARSALAGWSLKASAGKDWGKIYGNNTGFQLTVTKCGLLQKSKRK